MFVRGGHAVTNFGIFDRLLLIALFQIPTGLSLQLGCRRLSGAVLCPGGHGVHGVRVWQFVPSSSP